MSMSHALTATVTTLLVVAATSHLFAQDRAIPSNDEGRLVLPSASIESAQPQFRQTGGLQPRRIHCCNTKGAIIGAAIGAGLGWWLTQAGGDCGGCNDMPLIFSLAAVGATIGALADHRYGAPPPRPSPDHRVPNHVEPPRQCFRVQPRAFHTPRPGRETRARTGERGRTVDFAKANGCSA